MQMLRACYFQSMKVTVTLFTDPGAAGTAPRATALRPSGGTV